MKAQQQRKEKKQKIRKREDRIREKIDNQGRAKDLTIDVVSFIRNFEATKFPI